MRWNVVVTTRPEAYDAARKALSALGPVGATDFYDVLVMEVERPERFLDDLRDLATRTPRLPEWIGHAVPCTQTFGFQSPEAFEAAMAEVLVDLLPALAGRRFYVRIHRRGFKGRLHAAEEERAIGEAVLTSLAEVGTPASVSFEDPEVVLDVEIVGTRAGVALLAPRDLEVFPVARGAWPVDDDDEVDDGLDPLNPDTDGDGLADGEEEDHDAPLVADDD